VSTPLNIAIIGATSGIAEQCAQLWAQRPGVSLQLVGRDAQKLERVQAHLQISHPQAAITVLQAQLGDAAGVRQMTQALCARATPDMVLIAHGSLPDQARCQSDLDTLHEALQVNAVSPALCTEAIVERMVKAGHGTVGLIGSVAGDRGRQSNYAYGAAKGLLTRYAQGLQHRLAGSAVKVVLIKPGPTDTAMTAHLKGSGTPLASAADVARDIVRAMDRGQPTLYTPAKWALIMLIIQHLPRFIFNKMKI
jgi:decaprenylphospho-beta-D-erythro-pentofuranosid-2-ulose 2-reductase